tara:strand:- start:182 stop:472 length:291 start_codon:yes stop_codon:yes gene_type:complete
LQEQYENVEDLMIIGVDVQEPESKVGPYLERHGVTFPVTLDTEGSLAQLFYVSGYPTTVFISPEGILVGSVPGYIQEEQMASYIDYARNYKPGQSQ